MKRIIHQLSDALLSTRTLCQSIAMSVTLSCLIFTPTTQAANISLANEPLFLVKGAEPLMMLTMSKDHQLFFKAFDDYSDLDKGTATVNDYAQVLAEGENYTTTAGDDAIDTTYKNNIVYYGYFDSYKCYDYSGYGRFIPAEYTTTKYCEGDLANKWSGNFLNWATMTRIDVTRKILYGGLRSTQDASTTILERTNLPTDSHSFVKYYNGTDLGKLTPYGTAQGPTGGLTSGISICNTNAATSGFSHNTTSAPIINIAQGAWLRWPSQESGEGECSFRTDPDTGTTTFGTQTIYSGRPNKNDANQFIATDIVRVEVCDQTLIDYSSPAKTSLSNLTKPLDNQENCKAYTDPATGFTVNRPIGLLHTYGENNRMYFGLMTGSYTKNISGGVLRRNIDSFQDEVDQTNGKFKVLTGTGNGPGIIKTIDTLRIYGYDYAAKNYANNAYDGCSTGDANPQWQNGKCASWGNPQSEIFLETLRYMANKGVESTAFNTDDSAKFPALTPVTWKDPMSKGQYCSALNVLSFNASTVSWDGDELTGANDINLSGLSALTDTIGAEETITGNTPEKEFFIGLNGINNNRVCSPKTISNLSTAQGICPEEPRLQGSYQMSGLAWYANTTDLRSDKTGKQTIKTFGVALSPAVPKIEVPFGTKTVTLLPACYNTTSNTTGNQEGTCGLVEFRQIEATSNSGKYLVLWETNDKGADYDMDMQGILEFSSNTTTNTLTVKTNVFAESTGAKMLFGYVISGTTQDGFHAHSGNTESGRGDGKHPSISTTDSDKDTIGVITCNGNTTTITRCNTGATNQSEWTYALATSTASILKPPLYYAAKWGGFNETSKKGGTGLDANELVEGTAAQPDIDGEWDNDDDDVPDNYFFANDPAKLNDSLSKAFEKVVETEASSASSVATNATRLETNTVIYQAKFRPSKWSGELIAYGIFSDDKFKLNSTTEYEHRKGELNINAPNWTTNNPDVIPAAASRNIITWNTDPHPTISGKVVGGSPFLWVDLNTSQQEALKTDLPSGITATSSPTNAVAFAQKRLNWLRGDSTDEGDTSVELRNRLEISSSVTSGTTTTTSLVNIVLGDIVNSDPVFVGEDNYGLEPLEAIVGAPEDRVSSTPITPSYAEFVAQKSSTTAIKHKLMLVGSNDGMLHAFDVVDGKEKFAYIPNNVFSKLYKLTQQNYKHDYYVDGKTVVSDAFIKGQWRTIMVGSTGAGGNAVFAIDITDREFSTTNTIDKDDVLWEYSPSTIGAMVGQPRIGRLANGKWAAIISSGYPTASTTNNVDRLILIDLETGAVIKEISTGVASTGLGTPTLIPNANRIIKTVYAGDMLGNVWKFDLSSSSTSNWKVAFGSVATPAPLFPSPAVNITDTNIQPITVPLTVGVNPSGGVNIYFGTGQYLASNDNIVPTNPVTQSFYAINDKGVVVTKSGLVKQSILTDNGTLRTTSQVPVNYTGSGSNQGWYLNLATPSTSGDVAVGERVVKQATLRLGRIIFPTFIPSIDPCAGGGKTYLMEMNALNGNQLSVPVFDINGDGKIDASDSIVSGQIVDEGKGMGSSVTIVDSDVDGIEYKYITSTSGAVVKITESNNKIPLKGRQSWRQMK